MKMLISTTTGAISAKVGDKEAIRIIANAGFDAYDFNMENINIEKNSPLLKENYKEYLKELKETADECKITCNQAHAPFPSQIYGSDEYNKFNFDLIVRSMEAASFLGAKVIIVHPMKEWAEGHGGTFKDYPHKPFKDRDELFSANIEFYKRLLPYCKKYNIKVALENLWIRNRYNREYLLPSTCGRAGEFVKFLDALDRNWFVGCVDIGHCLLVGEKPEEFIRTLKKERLGALHIHDVNGFEDNHVLPYQMSVDWEEVIKALAEIGYEGDFTFEAGNSQKKYPIELLPAATEFMYKIGKYMTEKIEAYKK